MMNQTPNQLNYPIFRESNRWENVVDGNSRRQHLKQSFKELRVNAQFARAVKQDAIKFSLVSPLSHC